MLFEDVCVHGVPGMAHLTSELHTNEIQGFFERGTKKLWSPVFWGGKVKTWRKSKDLAEWPYFSLVSWFVSFERMAIFLADYLFFWVLGSRVTEKTDESNVSSVSVVGAFFVIWARVWTWPEESAIWAPYITTKNAPFWAEIWHPNGGSWLKSVCVCAW